MTAIERKRNVPGYIDDHGRFRPIRSASFVGSGTSRRPAKVRDRKKYSKAKAGDLGAAKQERALEDVFDREIRLERESAARKAKDEARILKEIEADAYGHTSQRKARTLAQFVRGEGGIRRTFRHGGKAVRGKRSSWDSGEIDRLTLKGSGSSGLTTSRSDRGKTMDYMFQAARESGYDVTSIDDMMERIENEVTGGKPTYPTHGSLSYNPQRPRNRFIVQLFNGDGHFFFSGKVFATNHAAAKKAVKARAEKVYGKLGANVVARSAYAENEAYLMKNPSVAQTILQQLGGNKFLAMTGAKTLVNHGNGLSFKLPSNFAREGINYVKIILNGRDLYDVEYGKIRGSKYTVMHESRGIYNDMLRTDFSRMTGLNVSLGTMGRKNPKSPSAARLAKAAIAVFDEDLDLDLDAKDVRILEKAKRKKQKTNPDLLSMFANGAVGIASALQIKEYMNRPKRKAAAKQRGTTKAKANPVRRTTQRPAADLSKEFYLMPFGSSGKRKPTVHLCQGSDTFKEFPTAAAARAFAAKHKIRLAANPTPKTNGLASTIGGAVKRSIARGRAKREYGKELRLEAAIERTRSSRRKAEAKAKANPVKWSDLNAEINSYYRLPDDSPQQDAEAYRLCKKYKVKTIEQLERLRDRLFNALLSRNPKSTSRRRTFEMFQGRKATTAKPMVVSNHAPATLDQLGDLVELKINGGPKLTFTRGVKLCAGRGKLWIAGKRFAKPNPAAKVNEVNPIGEIDHVVYGTRKPHHGDHAYTHYIHKLGEESGKRPILCVDREGYPVIRGGNYKIEARGIVD